MFETQNGFKTKIKHLYYKFNDHAISYDLSPYKKMLHHIDTFDIKAESDQALKQRIGRIKSDISTGATLSNHKFEWFAIVREVSERLLGMRHYDTQMIAGLAMANKKLVQMETGEGKTLAAVLTASLKALTGKSVHILTANDYLAKRDAHWMGPVYRFLGITVRHIDKSLTKAEKRSAYAAMVTYGTAKEIGFDFLRDSSIYSASEAVQRDFQFCIVDEADFILIDESRVPLVIAGAEVIQKTLLEEISELSSKMEAGRHFETDRDQRNVILSESGIEFVEKNRNIKNLFDPKNGDLLSLVNLCLHARALLEKDKDYIIHDGKVEIVDEFTGRVASNRRWSNGIHSAVEAKEAQTVQREGRILNAITIQHFISLYPEISGMTATAEEAAEEINTFYGMGTLVIPPNKESIRIDKPDQIFSNNSAKTSALLNRIREINKKSQPILVGTASVKESEQLSAHLERMNIPHQVLNAKNPETEAASIAQAGKLGKVTISTNMAGRGTDIVLGGGDEIEGQKVKSLGGLYLIGTNRHESRRIDNQLRGRSGRQGDPGITEFFVCMADDLMARYQIDNLIPRSFWPQSSNAPIKSAFISKEIHRAQRIIEGQHFEIRRTLWEYSELLERQRKKHHEIRNQLLNGENPYKNGTINPDPQTPDSSGTPQPPISEELLQYVSLYFHDQAWQHYLEKASEIKEGIHLMRYGGHQPLDQFRIQTAAHYQQMYGTIIENIDQTLLKLTGGISESDLEKLGIKKPASTWTYLINDNPFSNFGLNLIANQNIGTTAFGGIIFIMYLPLFIIAGSMIKIKKYLSKKEN